MVQRMLCWCWHHSNYLSQPNIALFIGTSEKIQIRLPNVGEMQTRWYFLLQKSLDSLNSKLSCLFKANAKCLLGKSKYNIVCNSKGNFGSNQHGRQNSRWLHVQSFLFVHLQLIFFVFWQRQCLFLFRQWNYLKMFRCRRF